MTAATARHDVACADERIESVLAETLRYARDREYTGWDYADGMSSGFLRALPVDNKWLNIAVQETIKRAPVNVRPYALVEQRRSYMGAALFAMANLNAEAVASQTDGSLAAAQRGSEHVAYVDEAHSLVDWLVENRRREHSGYCGSHRHVFQELDGQRHPSDADVVSTEIGVRALLAARNLDSEYGDLARTAAQFVRNDLDYTETESGARINYATCDGDEHYTLNAIALGGRLFVELHDAFGDEEYRTTGERLLDYVVARQTDIGGWMYREPPSASHLSMDNHHNGFIIDCLQHHEAVTGSDRYAASLSDAVTFYRRRLFEADGAPNWDEERTYPRDIHAAAQGITVFTNAGDLAFANRIIDWVLSTLYGGDGQFYFRQTRWFTKRIVLMRWCQAWMAYALSCYVAAARDVADRRRAVSPERRA